MKAFREQASWTFFLVLSYGILIGMFTSSLIERIKRNSLKFLALFGVIAILFGAVYPMFTGQATANWLNPQNQGSYIPDYFRQAEQHMSDNGWTLLLPQRNMYLTYNFSDAGVFNAGNPYPYLFSKPILYGSGTEYIKSNSVDVIQQVYDLLNTSSLGKTQQDNGRLVQVLGLLGIRNLLFENKTIILGLTGANDTIALESFNLTDRWTYASFYENLYAQPMIYCADTIDRFDNITELYNSSTPITGSFCFSNDTSSLVGVQNDILVAPSSKDFEFWKESPVLYKGQANATGPFILLLLNTYDPSWKLTVNSVRVSEDHHFMANSFANAWVVDNKSSNQLRFQIEFEKQSITDEAVAISVGLSLFSGLVLMRRQLQNFGKSLREKTNSKIFKKIRIPGSKN
jgi:hypothetical protein